jgi:hypothetical protein
MDYFILSFKKTWKNNQWTGLTLNILLIIEGQNHQDWGTGPQMGRKEEGDKCRQMSLKWPKQREKKH